MAHQEAKDNRDYLATAIIGAFLTLWSVLICQKYFSFGYTDWDLAFFSHSMWNIIHLKTFNTIFGVNFLANHANLIAYLLAPLYMVFPSVLTLLFLKVLSFTLGGMVLYIIAKEKLSASLALLFIFLYFMHPAVIWPAFYEFDFESLSIFPLFLLLYFFIKNRLKAFIITSAFILLIKENMPLVICAFGLYASFTKKNKRLLWSLVPLVLGLIFFYLDVFIIMPFYGSNPLYGRLAHTYGHIAKTPKEALITILSQPLEMIRLIFDKEKLLFLLQLLFPLGFSSLLRLDTLFLALPIFLQHLLSKVTAEYSIYFFYSSTFLPFIFVSSVLGVAFLLNRSQPNKRRFSILISIYLIECSLISSFLWTKDAPKLISFWQKDHLKPYKAEALKIIPKEAAVGASFCFLARLSNRDHIYALHKIWGKGLASMSNPDQLFEKMEYAVIDFNDPILQRLFYSSPEKVSYNLYNFFTKDDWGPCYAKEDVVLFKKSGEKKENILTLLDATDFVIPAGHHELASGPGISFNNGPFILDDSLELAGYDLLEKNGDVLHFVFFWRVINKTNFVYEMQFFITDGLYDRFHGPHTLGYKIYLPQDIPDNKILREDYWLTLPKSREPGKHIISVNFVNATEKRSAKVRSGTKDLLDAYNKFILATYND